MIDRVAEIVRRAGAAALDTRVALREALLISDKNLIAAGASAAERVLKRRLLSLHPAALIAPGSWSADMSGDAWVITPLTGVLAYARWQSDFGVAVALLRRGEVILGVVHSPGTASTYIAENGSGAWTDDGRRCAVSGIGEATSAVNAALSLPLALARVAAGYSASTLSADDFPIWEVAAGALLVTQAGGCVLDGQGIPLRFNQPHQHVRGVRAGTPPHGITASTTLRDNRACNV